MKRTAWVLASERLPNQDEMGAFNRCEVIVQCDRGPGEEPWQVMKMGWLTFLGGDVNRPLWLQGDDKTGTPIENGSWYVTHWRPFPRFPVPVMKGFAA